MLKARDVLPTRFFAPAKQPRTPYFDLSEEMMASKGADLASIPALERFLMNEPGLPRMSYCVAS